MKLRADLSGDGRSTVEPREDVEHYGNPQPINLGGARRLIEAFLDEGGHSEGHSRLGQTIWVEQEFCEQQGLEYEPVEVEFEGETFVVGIDTDEDLSRDDFDVQLS